MLKAATDNLKGSANKNNNGDGLGKQQPKKRGPYGPRKPKDPNAPPPKPKQPRPKKDAVKAVVPKPILRKGEELDEKELEKGGKKMTAKMKAKEKAKEQAEKDKDGDEQQEYDARGGMGAKRKRGMFARDLRYMMYGFGDVRDPNNETVALVEDLMVDFITNVAQAMECAERRGGRFSNNDLLYVIRNDEKKMRRVEELMEMNEYLKEARKNFDLADPTVVEKTVEKDPE